MQGEGKKTGNTLVSYQKSNMLYPNILKKGRYIVTVNHKGDEKIETRIAHAFDVIEIAHNLDTEEISIKVSYSYKGQEKELLIPRGNLNRKNLLQYQSLGLDFFDHNIIDIIKYIADQEHVAPEVSVHSSIGWGEYNNKLVFKHFNAVGIDSTYCGELDIKPRGTLEGWKTAVKKIVLGNTPLELALTFGLAAPIVGMIGRDISIESIIGHIFGDSSKGKTTATMLAVSVCGNPDPTANSLMRTWNATNNALIASLSGNNGLIMAFDELSMSDMSDFTITLYRLSGGRDKDRRNKDMTQRIAGTWNTSIFSNGECSILSKSKENTGLKVRVSEYSNIEWTRNAASSEELKSAVLKNNGHACIAMAERLLELGKSEVIKRHKCWVTECLSRLIVKDQFSERISVKLAVLMLSAEIGGEALRLNMNLEGILEMLVKNEAEAVDGRSLGQKAYDWFLQQYNAKRSMFIIEHRTPNCKEPIPSRSVEAIGKIIVRPDGTEEVCIIPAAFDDIMRAGKFDDSKVILKRWKEEKRIDYEKDRLTRQRKISGNIPIQVYVIHVGPNKPDKGSKKGDKTEEQ